LVIVSNDRLQKNIKREQIHEKNYRKDLQIEKIELYLQTEK